MVTKFLTQAEDRQFKAWLAQHSNGFYLNECARGNIKHGQGDMMLHKVSCSHLGTGEGVISTTYAKAASDDQPALRVWAQENGLNVKSCSTCKPD